LARFTASRNEDALSPVLIFEGHIRERKHQPTMENTVADAVIGEDAK
jgi:hypothetical protein